MKDGSRTVYLVARIYHLIREQIDKTLAGPGITSVQYSVLSLIRGAGGLSSAQLARRYRVKPQSMNKIVRDLEDAGLVRRSANWENRRVLIAELTPQGDALLNECDRLIDAYELDLMRDMPPDDIAAFRRVAKGLMERGIGRHPDPSGHA